MPPSKSVHIGSLERALHRLGEAERQLRQATAIQLGVGVVDLDTLLLLDDAGPLAAGEIAEALSITTGGVTGLIDRLQKAGWVRRTKHPTDRRRVLAEIVPERQVTISDHRRLREALLAEALPDTKADVLHASVAVVDKSAEAIRMGAQSLARRDDEPGIASEDGTRAPIGDAVEGRLRILSGAPQLSLRGARIRDLYRASFEGHRPKVRVDPDGTVTFQYKGFAWFASHAATAAITLTSTLPWTIEIRGGVAQLTADLRGLSVRTIDVSGGASESTLNLPAPVGEGLLRVKGGANHVVVRRPRGTAVQAIVRGGVNSLALDEQRVDSLGATAHLATPGWKQATDRWTIELSGGASDLSVTED